MTTPKEFYAKSGQVYTRIHLRPIEWRGDRKVFACNGQDACARDFGEAPDGPLIGWIERGRTLHSKVEFRFVPNHDMSAPNGPVRLGQYARAVDDARVYAAYLSPVTGGDSL